MIRSNNMASGIIWLVSSAVTLILLMPISRAYTNEQDVYAINSFYAALGSPPLPGWIATGGDPCSENWQGVQCVGPNITGIVINAANLGGQLGDQLGNFTTIITIDLSNNNIGGSIPENLPLTMQKFFLSANQFTGSIPDSLSKLTLLTDMSLNYNQLTGNLPDAFQALTGLINLDLSSNNLSGQLPPSTVNLSSLTTFHVQNNQLSGSLNVLEDLPLKDLNIENNLFSGPIPEKLLSIPKFKKDGNPFNTSVAPSSAPLGSPQSAPPVSPPSSPPRSPSPSPPSRSPPSQSPPSGVPSNAIHSNSSNGPSAQGNTHEDKKGSKSTMKVVGYVVLAVVLFIIMALIVICLLSKYKERKIRHEELLHSQIGRPGRDVNESKFREELAMPNNEIEKVSKKTTESNYEYGSNIKMTVPQEVSKKENDHIIHVGETDVTLMPPHPVEKVVITPFVPARNITSLPSERLSPPPLPPPPPTSVASFSVASLQQYTNSFDEENLIRESRMGKIYLAEHPDGTMQPLEVMKIDNVNPRIAVDDFLDLVLIISELRHPNIVELVGYCAEFEQRLLVYKFFSKKTLDDILHCGDDINRKLSWNARLFVSLGAAKALEHLHEKCQPPLVHKYFEPANLLVDDEFNVRVSECGLSLLRSSSSVTQLSGRLRSMFAYEAPELNESGTYTDKSDVYSFGVVMLELLTGRKPYDSSRPRPEQHLVKWASSQLYEIDALSRMVDPSIAGKCPEKSLSLFADIISSCIQQQPEFRPPMSAVVQDLTSMLADARGTTTKGDLSRRTMKGNLA